MEYLAVVMNTKWLYTKFNRKLKYYILEAKMLVMVKII